MAELDDLDALQKQIGLSPLEVKLIHRLRDAENNNGALLNIDRIRNEILRQSEAREEETHRGWRKQWLSDKADFEARIAKLERVRDAAKLLLGTVEQEPERVFRPSLSAWARDALAKTLDELEHNRD